MLHFLIKKLWQGALVLLGVVVLVFVLFQGFGDPAKILAGQTSDAKTRENIRRELYLDKPVLTQFLYYLNDVSPVSFYSAAEREKKGLHGFHIGTLTIKWPYLRTSYQTRRPVADMLMQVLPGTILLAVAALFIAVIIGIPLGMLAATHKGSWLDSSSIFAAIIGISVPSFFMAIILAYLFGFVWSGFTGLHLTGSWLEINSKGQGVLQLQNLILPAVTLGIRPLAIIMQLTRSSMLDVLDQDYIRTAYAKGLGHQRVIWRHALPNALNPVITAITGWFAELLAGAFFVEFIFGWDGIGNITVQALEQQDFTVVMGSVLVTAAFFVVINILADLLYAWIDPRVKLGA